MGTGRAGAYGAFDRPKTRFDRGTASMQWTIVVLWLMSEAALPTRSGILLGAREPFATVAACQQAIPGYEEQVRRDFGARGIVACVARPVAGAADAATP